MKYKIYITLTCLLILLIQTSCVEHIITIHVNSGGDFKFFYSGKGDLADINNEDFPKPAGNDWMTTQSYDPNERNHLYQAEKVFQNDDEFPANFFTSDTIYEPSLLHHPLTVEHYTWFFKDVYRINWSFHSRRVDEKYPGMATVLREGETVQGWTAEAIEYLFSECLDRADLGFNQEPIIKADLDRWITESVQTLPDSLIEEKYSTLKTEGLLLVKQILDENQSARVDSIFKQLEDESLITLDLIDDHFIVNIILPGDLVNSNADTTLTDTLQWEFNVNDFHSSDFQMIATSQIIHPEKYYWLFGFLLLILIGLMFWIRKPKTS